MIYKRPYFRFVGSKVVRGGQKSLRDNKIARPLGLLRSPSSRRPGNTL